MTFDKEKDEIIFWARQLNRRGFVTARSGNISTKVEENKILITSHDSYLGYLEENEILLLDLDGNVLTGNFDPAIEKDLHLGIYREFDDVKVVMHAHSPFSTAFFHYYESLENFSFESKFYLGDLQVVPQNTPTVTELSPVLSALVNGSIVVLKNHGVVSVGDTFKSAYGLIELLEEQARVNFSTQRLERKDRKGVSIPDPEPETKALPPKRYVLLSEEHCERLTTIVNNNKEVQGLGRKYNLTCRLALKNQDTGHVACFHYEKGKIVRTDHNETADFVVTGKETILKKIFNSEINPFVAVTQGKVKTEGDFVKMSVWYPVLEKTFKLWEHAPVK